MTDFCSCYARYCSERGHLLRTLPQPREAKKNVLDFSTNDYLGLSKHPQIVAAAAKAAVQFGAGATGARLLSGNMDLFEKFEAQIARGMQTEAALLFQSGYQANSTVLASLLDPHILGKQALVFFDKGNHASLYPGVFLSQAHLERYRHADMADLEQRLLKYAHDERPKFIVTETLFSMDGDLVDLSCVLELAKRFHAFVYLDEAHAVGLYGPSGYGLSTCFYVQDVDVVIVGTFGKALGSCGAYVACRQDLQKFLINRCPGFIYSTAPSPIIVAAAQEAWQMVPSLSRERMNVLAHSSFLRAELQSRGWKTGCSPTGSSAQGHSPSKSVSCDNFPCEKLSSHILGLIVGKEELALKEKERLFEKGIVISAIRPPTIPKGTSRLRIALTALHSEVDICRLIEALGDA